MRAHSLNLLSSSNDQASSDLANSSSSISAALSGNQNIPTSATTSHTKLGGTHKRILSFAEAPPPSSGSLAPTDIRLRVAATSKAIPKSQASINAEAKKRSLNKLLPDRVLDAPGMSDDFYSSLLSWSCYNLLAVGLADAVYVWNAESGSVDELCAGDGEAAVSSLEWSGDGAYLAIAWENGQIQLWDVESKSRLRTMGGHAVRTRTFLCASLAHQIPRPGLVRSHGLPMFFRLARIQRKSICMMFASGSIKLIRCHIIRPRSQD